MAVHIVWNTLKDPAKQETAKAAVLDALSHRPPSEHWDVKLTESAAIPGWVAVLLGPNHTKVAWYFQGYSGEDTAEAVRTRIGELLRAVGY